MPGGLTLGFAVHQNSNSEYSSRLEEASTHESAVTHAGNDYFFSLATLTFLP